MMKNLCAAALLILALCSFSFAADERQSPLDPAKAATSRSYPRIVLYSVAWCPHCREAKEYLTRNNIPFINRDVELDEKAMEELTGTYGSSGVPVLVFGGGKDEIVMKGFNPELFQQNLQKARARSGK